MISDKCLCATASMERLYDNLKFEKILRSNLSSDKIPDIIENLKTQVLEIKKTEDVCGIKFGKASEKYGHAAETLANGKVIATLFKVEEARFEMRRRCGER